MADSHLIDVTLAAHNQRRELHSVGSLAWDADCYTTAQKWAETLAQQASQPGKGGQGRRGLFHGGLGKGMGQNLWWSPNYAATPIDAIDAWMREAKHYNPQSPVGTGNFTQVVWKKTKKVGLAIVRVPRPSHLPPPEDGNGSQEVDESLQFQFGTFIVAHYHPHGNTKGRFQENVFLPRVPATKKKPPQPVSPAVPHWPAAPAPPAPAPAPPKVEPPQKVDPPSEAPPKSVPTSTSDTSNIYLPNSGGSSSDAPSLSHPLVPVMPVLPVDPAADQVRLGNAVSGGGGGAVAAGGESKGSSAAGHTNLTTGSMLNMYNEMKQMYDKIRERQGGGDDGQGPPPLAPPSNSKFTLQEKYRYMYFNKSPPRQFSAEKERVTESNNSNRSGSAGSTRGDIGSNFRSSSSQHHASNSDNKKKAIPLFRPKAFIESKLENPYRVEMDPSGEGNSRDKHSNNVHDPTRDQRSDGTLVRMPGSNRNTQGHNNRLNNAATHQQQPFHHGVQNPLLLANTPNDKSKMNNGRPVCAALVDDLYRHSDVLLNKSPNGDWTCRRCGWLVDAHARVPGGGGARGGGGRSGSAASGSSRSSSLPVLDPLLDSEFGSGRDSDLDDLTEFDVGAPQQHRRAKNHQRPYYPQPFAVNHRLGAELLLKQHRDISISNNKAAAGFNNKAALVTPGNRNYNTYHHKHISSNHNNVSNNTNTTHPLQMLLMGGPLDPVQKKKKNYPLRNDNNYFPSSELDNRTEFL